MVLYIPFSIGQIGITSESKNVSPLFVDPFDLIYVQLLMHLPSLDFISFIYTDYF